MESVLLFPPHDAGARFLDRVKFDFAGTDFAVVVELWGKQGPHAADPAVTLSSGRRLVARLVNQRTGEAHYPCVGPHSGESARPPSQSHGSAPGASA